MQQNSSAGEAMIAASPACRNPAKGRSGRLHEFWRSGPAPCELSRKRTRRYPRAVCTIAGA
ncbi:Uncharacterised protein [Bordetella pertussis]|nr:Uncharacterised protein [Bordetella pertussis]